MLIEDRVIAHLKAHLSAPVYAEVPASAADGAVFVIVEKTGASETNHIMDATLAIQSYGQTLRQAALLSYEVRLAMESLAEEDEIGRCAFETEYNYTDTSTKRYRYQAVFHLTYYGG